MKLIYAILLDGGFVTKKLIEKHGRPALADDVVQLRDRLRRLADVADYELLRIYYYDAHPSSQPVKQPVSSAPHPLADTPRYRQSQSLFGELELKAGSPYAWAKGSSLRTCGNLRHASSGN